MEQIKIKGYLKTSLIEWPGKVCSIVYTPGCNFACPFCHNRDLVDSERTLGLKDIRDQSIFDDLKIRKKWIDAVVVTGGEPTLQSGLEGFLDEIKKRGFLTMLETNGSKPEVLKKLFRAKLLDKIAMDIKGPLDEQYAPISNFQFPISQIEDSIKLILESKIEYEFRTTVVPGIHDKAILAEMANQLAIYQHQTPGTLRLRSGQAKHLVWVLQNFQPKNCLNPAFEKVKPYSEEKLKELFAVVEKIFPGIVLR